MLHNIYPTMLHLKKWKIKETENCTNCGIPESLRHATYDCVVARDAINHLELEINSRYFGNRAIIKLSYEDITFGVNVTSSIKLKKIQMLAIDTIIIELKQKLVLQREQKNFISRQEVHNLFDCRKRLEKYNSIKYRKFINVEVKWGADGNMVGL